ncbi:MAG: phytanoyl-CoA dioxygenase family protein [Myxococcota bacterium]|nr:phytanoyl-CoA dioxygenase family protein [Myxococcota bacterium]
MSDNATALPEPGARFVLGTTLTDVQRQFLDRYGYLHFEGVASEAEVARIAEELDGVEARLLAERTKKIRGVPLFFGRDWKGAVFIQRFAFASCFSSWLKDFFGDERFEPVRALVGSEARIGQEEKDGVVVNRFLNSPGSVRNRLGWHTDGLRDLFYLRMPVAQLNVGLHLDAVGAEDGGLRILPGTHRQGFFSMCFRKPYFVWHRPDPEEFVVETRPGDLTLHDGRLWHRVARSRRRGQASLRRSIYVPYLTGPYEPKDERSTTPFYHRLGQLQRTFKRALGLLPWMMFLCVNTASGQVPEGGAVSEGALAGTFALKVVTAEEVRLPIVGKRDSGGINLLLVTRHWDPENGRYRQQSRLCDVVNQEVAGTLIRIPKEAQRTLPMSEQELVFIEHAEGRYRMKGHHQAWGLRGTHETFPPSAEAARVDSRVYDMDQDGQPGITMRSEGWLEGDIYGVQSKRVDLSGSILDENHVVGVSEVRKASWVLGASNPLLSIEGPSGTPHTDPLASWFEEVRIPMGSDCSAVKRAAETGRLSERRPF